MEAALQLPLVGQKHHYSGKSQQPKMKEVFIQR